MVKLLVLSRQRSGIKQSGYLMYCFIEASRVVLSVDGNVSFAGSVFAEGTASVAV